MDLMYAIINMGGMYICFACCMIVAAQRPSYGQKYLLMTNVCAFIITVGDALEFFAKTQDAALVATKMAYVGKMHIMLFALLFVTGFTQVGMNKKIAWALELYNTILLAAVMTCENHSMHLFPINCFRVADIYWNWKKESFFMHGQRKCWWESAAIVSLP